MSDYTYILKTETDGRQANQILALTLLDTATGRVYSFADAVGHASIKQGVECALLADALVQHTSYHTKVIERLFDVQFDPARLFDTFAAARDHLGHTTNSLDAWAARLGMTRYNFRGAEVWTAEIQRHCENDARIVAALYSHLLKELCA